MTVDEAIRILDINTEALNALYPDTEAAKRELHQQARANYRRRALRAHPDQGGEQDELIRLTEARDLLLHVQLRVPRRQSQTVPFMTGAGIRVHVNVHSGGYPGWQSFANWTTNFTSSG